MSVGIVLQSTLAIQMPELPVHGCIRKIGSGLISNGMKISVMELFIRISTVSWILLDMIMQTSDKQASIRDGIQSVPITF